MANWVKLNDNVWRWQMPKLFGWDEISNEVHEYKDTDELREINEEGGWLYDHLLPNGVAVLKTDRHWAIETWADSEQEALLKFSMFQAFAKAQAWKEGG